MESVKPVHSSWDYASKAIIWGFSIIFYLLAALTPSVPIGESDDYMAATLALENHFSLKILESDIEDAKTDFPEHYERLRNSYDNAALGSTDFAVDKHGNRYPWYIGTYSLVCIPVKYLLKMLGLNQSMAFQLTNVTFYVLALLTVYFKLQVSTKVKFLTILLLACSPTVLYYFWASAEMFMFALVTMAMVFFANRNYHLSALLIAAVGTLNPTVMPLGVALIADYFITMYQNECQNERNFLKLCLYRLGDIIKFGSCFLPFFLTYIFNYIHFGVFNLQSTLGLVRMEGWLGRMNAYLFDLNFGFVAYFFVAFVLFWLSAIWGIIWKRDVRSLIYLVGFMLVVATYSITWHINCGMTGISRYNAWSFPIFIFYLTTQAFPLITHKTFQNVFVSLLVFSACWTTGYTYIIRTSPTGMVSTYMSPMAIFVLDKAPKLYQPYYYTFISRVEHEDGGYWGDWGNENMPRRPVVYTNAQGYVKKILVMAPVDIPALRLRIVGNEADMAHFVSLTQGLDVNKRYQYIDIPSGVELSDIGEQQ